MRYHKVFLIVLVLLLTSPSVRGVKHYIYVDEFQQEENHLIDPKSEDTWTWTCESVYPLSTGVYCHGMIPPHCLLTPGREPFCSKPSWDLEEAPLLEGVVYQIDTSTKIVNVGVIPNIFDLFLYYIFCFFVSLGILFSIARCCDPTFS